MGELGQALGARPATVTASAGATVDGVPAAVIVGLDCLQGLQSARLLAERGVPVIGVAKDPDHFATRSNACQRVLITDTGGERLVDTLEELGPMLDEKAVLFPCQDKNVIVISEHRDRLKAWYHIMLPSHATVELLMDKAAFYRYAREKGLPIPPTYFLYSQEEAEEIADQVRYPCILKPPFRLREWSRHTKEKAFIVTDRDSLLATYERVSPWADGLILQHLIPGKDTDHYTCNCYFGTDGEPLVTFTSRKLRQWPPRTGQACLSEEVAAQEVVDTTVRVYQGLDHRGLGYLEMKQDSETAEYLIIEPNVGRPTGRAAQAEAAGVELLYTMYADAAGLPLPSNRQQTYRGVKWVHLLRDTQASVHHLLRGELALRDWWRSLRGPKVFAILSWRDPLASISAVVSPLRKALRRARSRSRNRRAKR